MSKAFFGKSGLGIFCENGKGSFSDNCSCVYCEGFPEFSVPGTATLFVVGIELPQGVAPGTPLYSSIAACTAAINSMSLSSAKVLINGGTYTEDIKSTNTATYYVGLGVVEIIGSIVNILTPMYFKNLKITGHVTTLNISPSFYDCILDLTVGSNEYIGVNNHIVYFYCIYNCDVKIVCVNGSDGVLGEGYHGGAGWNGASFSVTFLGKSTIDVTTGNGGKGGATRDGGRGGAFRAAHICNCVFANITIGKGGDGGDGLDNDDGILMNGGDGALSGELYLEGIQGVNIITDIVFNNGGKGGSPTNYIYPGNGLFYAGEAGHSHGIGNFVLRGNLGSEITILNITLPLRAPDGADAVQDTYKMGYAGRGGSAAGWFQIYTSGQITINCDVHMPDGGDGGIGYSSHGGNAPFHYHDQNQYPRWMFHLQGNITVNGNIHTGNGGNSGGDDDSYTFTGNGGRGGDIMLENGVLVTGSVTTGNGGDGGDGIKYGGDGGQGGDIFGTQSASDTFGIGGLGGTGSIHTGADGKDGEFRICPYY